MPANGFRKRYVVFQIEAPRTIQRWELIAALQDHAERMGMNSEGKQRPWLTAFQDNRGILRCAHTDKEKTIELLTSITEAGEDRTPVEIKTLKTSGTIKKAKEFV